MWPVIVLRCIALLSILPKLGLGFYGKAISIQRLETAAQHTEMVSVTVTHQDDLFKAL